MGMCKNNSCEFEDAGINYTCKNCGHQKLNMEYLMKNYKPIKLNIDEKTGRTYANELDECFNDNHMTWYSAGL